jgi:hypothetical protein
MRIHKKKSGDKIMSIPIKEATISRRISECSECHNNAPFFFEISGQKAMIITAAGNLQTTYFSLITVRFVRNLLYSLFGKKGLTEAGFRRLFESDGIYWTSFHKCYDRRFFRKVNSGYAMAEFESEKCAEIFLQDEINAVHPQLLIIMGKAVCDAIHKMVEKRRLVLPDNVLFADYFHLEQNERIVCQVRQALAQTLSFEYDDEPFDKKAAATTKTEAEVHYQFQLSTARELRSIHGGGINFAYAPDYENEVEQLWIKQVAAPIVERYYTFLNYWSAIESSSRSFLCNKHDDDTSPKVSGKDRYKQQSYNDSYSILQDMTEMSEKWITKLNNYLWSIKNEFLFSQWRVLCQKLRVISDIRNSIVHSMGFIPFKTIHASFENYQYNYEINHRLIDNGFTGIKVIPNMVYISEKGLSEMDNLFVQITSLLLRL